MKKRVNLVDLYTKIYCEQVGFPVTTTDPEDSTEYHTVDVMTAPKPMKTPKTVDEFINIPKNAKIIESFDISDAPKHPEFSSRSIWQEGIDEEETPDYIAVIIEYSTKPYDPDKENLYDYCHLNYTWAILCHYDKTGSAKTLNSSMMKQAEEDDFGSEDANDYPYIVKIKNDFGFTWKREAENDLEQFLNS